MDPLYAPLPEHSSKYRRFNRLINREGGHVNIKHKGISWWFLYKADSYRLILNLSWIPMLLVSFVFYSILIVMFAGLYYFRLHEIHGAEDFMDAFFFSLQTMNTIDRADGLFCIGYGFLYPTGFYSHCITFVQSWVGILAFGALTALVFAKLSRPARLRHTIDFSSSAVINEIDGLKITRKTKPISDKPGLKFLSIRLANIRKRQVCTAQIRLLMLRKVMDEECITVMTSKTKNSARSVSDDENEDYKINVTEYDDENKFLSEDFNAKKKRMIGSHRSSTDSDQPVLEYPQWKLIELTHDICDKQDTVANYLQSPAMVFPWHIVHTIDETSPLYGMTREAMRECDMELIVLLEGTDELTSATFQARWSYKAEEILWNRRFVDMVSKDNRGKFVVDFSRISSTVPVNTSVNGKPPREATKERPASTWRRSIPNQDDDNTISSSASRSSYSEFNPRSFGSKSVSLVKNPNLNNNNINGEISDLFIN